jgi:hypothetical protein
MIYKVIISWIFITFANLTSLFSQDSLHIQNLDKISETKLPALMITTDYFSPEDGIEISVAKTIIITELKKEDLKGDINSALKITEITTKESWQNNRIQIYRVKLDYAWLDGVVLIKDNKVLTILKGMPIGTVFLADLDNDSIYEIYTNYFLGSGIISEEIGGYNVSLNENYYLSMRMEKNLHLFIDNGILMASVRPYNKNKEKPIIKKVNLKKIDNKYELIIE